MLKIQNLHVRVGEVPIVKGITLRLAKGETHVLMGPNGSGKSTLAQALAGHPDYQIDSGRFWVDRKNLTTKEPTARALAGLFLSWQAPPILPGVKIATFLRAAANSHRAAQKLPPFTVAEFIGELRVKMRQLKLPNDFANRALNDGFSGGEKKRLELLAALLLKPKVLLLDEIDSGLDVDAIRQLATVINQLIKDGTTVLLITHYQRILNYITPDRVHIFMDGKIVKSGGPELAQKLEKGSYQQFVSHES